MKEEKNLFETLTDIQRVLQKWKMRTLQGNFVIIKTMVISKIVKKHIRNFAKTKIKARNRKTVLIKKKFFIHYKLGDI